MAHIEERPVKDYNCSQAELYAGLDIVWDSQAEHEAEFAAENTIYTPGLSVTRKAAIQAARALPDGQARYADAESLRILLVEKHELAIAKWNSLDGYISKAFKGANYKPRIEEAGKGYYEKAYAQNWEQVVLLMQSGKNFIDEHGAVLGTNGGMPATFGADFETARTEFGSTYGLFKDAQQDAQEETDAKIVANNLIYADGREMMEDGKHIFRKNASLRERFIWEKVLELVSTPGGGSGNLFTGDVAGMTVFNLFGPANTQWTAGVTLRLKNTTSGPAIGGLHFYSAMTDTDGWSGIGEFLLPGQEITRTFTAADFRPFFNIQNQGPNVQGYEVEVM
ncbi:MAG: hypothetical protein POELPBGB_02216 [Bacteroidia bacterium]|nr:hypothetical protein [Bacteroidia bacterium]